MKIWTSLAIIASLSCASYAIYMDLEDVGRQAIGGMVRRNARNSIKLIKFMKGLNVRIGPNGPPVHAYPVETHHKVVSHQTHLIPEPEHTFGIHHAESHPEPFYHHGFHHGFLGHHHTGAHPHHHGLRRHPFDFGIHIDPTWAPAEADGLMGFSDDIAEIFDRGLERFYL